MVHLEQSKIDQLAIDHCPPLDQLAIIVSLPVLWLGCLRLPSRQIQQIPRTAPGVCLVSAWPDSKGNVSSGGGATIAPFAPSVPFAIFSLFAPRGFILVELQLSSMPLVG
eukprot:Protomagalhaensia_wolfi_Nauph_80__4082@NODE_4141_length_630_cov_4_862944_g3284_i0_p1_GENE_NODE_4141_length_630_cov_4_862944_g3284_i0NODE_4141_length_630_cov_4_862944_g3284_i0_p1_ORF_typecomplete_len110_score8_63_NODE_4141_length_630_cov_4_862944_g3284_i0153482